MDRAAHTTPGRKTAVGRIDDGIDIEGRDVGKLRGETQGHTNK
jgi:hypothetical protein